MNLSREFVGFFAGITDRDWFDFLSRLDGLDEVNLWQPSEQQQFRALQIGEPFLFTVTATSLLYSTERAAYMRMLFASAVNARPPD